jgi:hypothetical protein
MLDLKQQLPALAKITLCVGSGFSENLTPLAYCLPQSSSSSSVLMPMAATDPSAAAMFS